MPDRISNALDVMPATLTYQLPSVTAVSVQYVASRGVSIRQLK